MVFVTYKTNKINNSVACNNSSCAKQINTTTFLETLQYHSLYNKKYNLEQELE